VKDHQGEAREKPSDHDGSCIPAFQFPTVRWKGSFPVRRRGETQKNRQSQSKSNDRRRESRTGTDSNTAALLEKAEGRALALKAL